MTGSEIPMPNAIIEQEYALIIRKRPQWFVSNY